MPRGYQKRKHGIARRCPHCGKPGGRQVVLGGFATTERATSWIITRKATGELIGEFFNRRAVDRFNPATCLIETAHEYLARLNRAIKGGKQA